MNSNPFESPGSEGLPSTRPRSASARLAFRCIAGLFLVGSFLPARVAWYFLHQDYLHIWPRESIIYNVELTGVGEFTNDQLILVGIALTLTMWALAATFLFLSRRHWA